MQLHLFNSLNTKALENVRSAIIVVDALDPEMPIICVNKAFEELTGFSSNEVLGRNCRFLQGADTNQPEINVIRSALANGRSAHAILRNYRKDGTLFYNELFIDPICDADGNVTHFVGCQNEIEDARTPEVLQNASTGMEQLTERERDVFELLVNGHSNKSIAKELQISPRTVEKHRFAVFKKFGVSDLTLLVRYAIALSARPRSPDEALHSSQG